jgi:type I restriction enzyme S subunit
VTSGGTPSTRESNYYDGDIPWLRTQEVNFNFITDTEIKITEAGLENSAAKWIPENSVVVALYGNSSGRVAINKIPLTTNQACGNLIIDPNEADYRFVYYALLKDYEVLHGMARGAAQNNLNLEQVKEYRIKIPPTIGMQKRIGDILVAYDDIIENNRRRMALLEESARQLYQEWFVRLHFPGCEHTRITKGVPEGWSKKVLGDICIDIREAVSPSDLEPDTPYIGLEHMPRRSISLSTWESADKVTSTKHRFRAGEILFGKIRPYFHKVGIAFVDGVASSDAIVIRPLEEQLQSLVLMTVSSDPFIAQASQTMREGSKMPRADWKLLKQYPVAQPPSGLLATFNITIGTITEQLKTLTFQNQKLSAARDRLLPRLMSGEIQV